MLCLLTLLSSTDYIGEIQADMELNHFLYVGLVEAAL